MKVHPAVSCLLSFTTVMVVPVSSFAVPTHQQSRVGSSLGVATEKELVAPVMSDDNDSDAVSEMYSQNVQSTYG